MTRTIEDERITGENVRLRSENTRLRERVAALESSRWWRLHPRLAVSRLRARSAAAAPPEAVETPPGRVDELTARFTESVVERGRFGGAWFTNRIAGLSPHLDELDGHAASILEIGSYEGLSACFFLWRFPDAHVTCVDTFEGSVENVAYGGSRLELEERFDENVALVDSSRVRKIRGDSRRVLLDLAKEDGRFDLVYVVAPIWPSMSSSTRRSRGRW